MKLTPRQMMAACGGRITALQGLTSHPGNLAGLESAFQGALATGDLVAAAIKDADKKMRELLTRAREKIPDAIDELNELRMTKIDLFVRASSQFASMLYETITLKDNEQACIETSYTNPVNVRYIGQDGGARTVKAVKARKQTFIDMRELTTDEVGYQMRDIQLGPDIAAAAQATVDIAWDARNKRDLEAFNLLLGGTINGNKYGTGVYGPFKTTGARLDRTYIPHARIQTGNLPLTNDIPNSALDDFATAGAAGLFRLAVIRAIMSYCDSWGDVFGGPLRPTGAIFIPSSEVGSLAQEIKPTGQFYNEVAESLLTTYTRFSYMGVNWTLIPDVTLPKGRCYPVLNRPVGRMLRKPSMDQEFVESNPRKNWETRSATQVVNFYTQEPDRVFALRVAYNSNPSALTTNE